MLEKVTVPQRIEIDPNTGVVTLVFAKCILDTDTNEFVSPPEPHRVPILPGENYDDKMAMLNTSIVRDLGAAPITTKHLEDIKKFVDFVQDPDTVTKFQDRMQILAQTKTPKA